MKNTLPYAAFALCALFAATARPETAATPADAAASDGTKTLQLPALDLDLPPGPGRQVVATTCATCHSPRYVAMQPRFSREAWTAEVQKMRKNYGAPIGEDQVKEAVDYLVTLRGPEGK